MFYCLFDLIDYYREQKGDTPKQMFDFFHKQKIRKATLEFFKDNCSIDAASAVFPAIEKYTGLSKLEVCLALGIVLEEYKGAFSQNISKIATLLRNSRNELVVQKTMMEPFFQTDLGTLYNGDCLQVLSSMDDDSVDLVFADPPFNLSKEYDEGINDSLSMTEYTGWCYKWISECIRVLKPGGSLFIYNIPKWTILFAEFLNKRLVLRSWIAVDMKFNLPLSGRLYPAHYGLLYYVKGDKPNAYNNQRIPLQTCRHCGGEIKDYGGYKNKMNPLGVNVSDVWTDIYPVRHRGTKNRDYNELSVKMLDRIISMSSNPGDIVFDPFGGSGTTYIVAEMLNRRWMGSELGNCDVIVERFHTISKDKELLRRVYEEKNMLFTKAARDLRIKNGFWLSEDFDDKKKEQDNAQISFLDLLKTEAKVV